MDHIWIVPHTSPLKWLSFDMSCDAQDTLIQI